MSKLNQAPYDAMVTVLQDVRFLCKFRDSHMISRGVWNATPEQQRKRMIAQEYVRVEPQRVILTEYGLEVIGYREATA